MLVTENSQQLIDTATRKVIELYNRVLGTQSNKQKLPYIAGAVAAVVLYKAYSVIALPPKALRGLPYINNFKVIWSTLRGDTPWIQYKKLYAPALAKSNNLGMYVVSEIFPIEVDFVQLNPKFYFDPLFTALWSCWMVRIRREPCPC
jgi:hypothetical protein